MNNQWQLAKRIFSEAIEQPTDSREDFVRQRCGDSETCQQVLELLHHHTDANDFLSSPIADAGLRDPFIGRIGNYVVSRRIGMGGMGAVYEATQEKPNRKVAIKMLRNDLANAPETIKRFQNESEFLGKLKHPNIASVYESGTFQNSDGIHPWFAMELIEGQNLKEFLDTENFDLQSRIKLFVKICRAVAYAHAQGVIHRDLKPANILVAGEKQLSSQLLPEPKIVDFGIARMIDSSNQIELTATRGVLGTMDYLSPEQITGHGNIDRRADVFSLGIILFEILTGTMPFDRHSGALTEIISRIEWQSSTPLRKIAPGLSRDLEIVVGKTLEIDPAQRYQSVDELIDELERVLRFDPIRARRSSVAYRTGKYLRRNKIMVGGTATTLLAMLAGLITYAIIADRANQAAADANYEARKAVAVNSFVTNDFLTRLLNNASESDPNSVAALVEKSAANIDSMFEDNLVRAAIRNEVGTIYYNIRAFEKSVTQYQIALELWEDGLGPEHPDTLKAVNNLGQAHLASGRSSARETEALCKRAYEGRLKVLGATHEATLRSLNNLAEVYRRQNKIEVAESLYLRGIDVISDSRDRQKELLALSGNLGSLYLSQKNIEKAKSLHFETFQNAKDILGPDHTMTLTAGIRYVHTLDRAKEFDTALATLEPILSEFEKIAAAKPGAIAMPLRIKAKILRHQNHDNESESVLEMALQAAMQESQEYPGEIAKINRDLARLRDPKKD